MTALGLHRFARRIPGDAYGGVPLAVIAAIVVSVALLLGNAGLLVINSARTLDANTEYARSYEIKRSLSSLQAALSAAESAQRGYLLTRQRSDRQAFSVAARGWQEEMGRLRQLTATSPTPAADIERLERTATAAVGKLEHSVQQTESATGDPTVTPEVDMAAAALASDDLDRVRAMLEEMMATEQARIDGLRQRVSRHIWVTVAVAVLATIVTVGVLVALQRLLRGYVAARAAAEKALRQANEQLNREVEERTSELTDLSRHLIRVAEEEKAKLARELHDTLGSNLTAINMDLNWVVKRLPVTNDDRRDDLRDRLQRALKMLTETVELKHQVIEGLRPSHLDNLGLTFAMRMHCQEFSRLTGMPCAMEVIEDFDDLDPALSIVLYRVVQEGLTNVMRHAQAKHVQISLQREDGGLRLRIRDDGVGLAEGNAARRASHGLIGMRERVRQVGGTFRASTAEGGGVLLDVFIPGVAPGVVEAATT